MDPIPSKRPLTKKTILQKYNGFLTPTKTVTGTDTLYMPVHNIKMTGKHVIKNIQYVKK